MNDLSTDTAGMDVAAVVADLGQRAKAAAQELALATADQRNLALREAAKALRARTDDILTANAADLDSISGKDAAFIDRLTLTQDRVAAMADAVDAIAAQSDPLGRTLATFDRPNGLKI
ncbi:MAG: gamma-glutamyl-phosphate reductase, partial [Alphaproteobacteria bacterium]|nr:gamma-glutamyl-phosphate reductase [Alphaproteobacteria bacterium]